MSNSLIKNKHEYFFDKNLVTSIIILINPIGHLMTTLKINHLFMNFQHKLLHKAARPSMSSTLVMNM